MTKNIVIKKLFSKSERGTENEGFEGPAEFEAAIKAVRFGKFNYILFLILIPSQWAIICDTNLMSYIAPIAQCDLDLSLDNKGTLLALPPFGAIIGAVFWGILLDVLGRKNLILYGFLLQGILTVITSLTQSYIFLLILKLASGAITGGLYIAECTYYAEFHSMEYRSKMQLSMGFISVAGHVVMPLVASYFLPLQLNLTLFNGYLKFHSWNLLIFVTSFLSFISGIVFIFLPESPKYMMTKGNNEEALSIFKKVYGINTGQSEDVYPISKLINEQNEPKYGDGKFSVIDYIRNGWHQLRPIFNKKYLPKLILISAIVFLIITDMNTLRLWLPQIFQGIHEYQATHNGTTAQLCVMLESFKTIPDFVNTTMPTCTVNTENNFSVYLNSVVNAVVCMIGYAMAGTLISFLGKKKLLCKGILGLLSTATIMTTYLSQNTSTTLALTSLYLAATGICFDVVMTMIVVIFPTSLRATAISTSLIVGRSGGILGSILFPILLRIGCAAPFLTLGSVAIVATLLCLLLPVADNDSLK